ncbi:LPXTG cell wall anchor domain-containing protein [Weissella cibaria]|uniref:LPXTG cell wall anchor domain-containing protein n=1 Tax=Weissella cibaria TaxID=137591 RepID=UPI00106EDA24|nr:LPXTG cell wall anchor domain-containing protein [Weissella cibaria]
MTEIATMAVAIPSDLPAVSVVYQLIPVTAGQPKRPVKQQPVVKHVPAKSVVRPVTKVNTKQAVAPATSVIMAAKRSLVTSETNLVSAAALPETGFEQEYWLTIAGLLSLLATAGVVLKKVL